MDTFILIEIFVFLGVIGTIFGVLVFETPLDKVSEPIAAKSRNLLSVANITLDNIDNNKMKLMLKSGLYLLLALMILYLVVIIFTLTNL